MNMVKLSDYDDELYEFYHHEESQVTSNSYGCNLDSETRKKVIDWLIKIHYEQKLMPETLYLCVNIFDRFLSKSNSEVTTYIRFQNLNRGAVRFCVCVSKLALKIDIIICLSTWLD
jgi:hypothetical protein